MGDLGGRMAKLIDLASYRAKFKKREHFTGSRFDTFLHIPCPFCGEPDWLIARVHEGEEALTRESVCRHCNRGGKAIFRRPNLGTTEFEIVQTSGPDAPAWLNPKPRRV